MKKKIAGTPVLVTTAHRGVFFGYMKSGVTDRKSVVISKARNCIYWSSDVKGFLGLASHGPTEACKIGPSVERLELLDVTSVSTVTNEAVEKWEKHPWAL